MRSDPLCHCKGRMRRLRGETEANLGLLRSTERCDVIVKSAHRTELTPREREVLQLVAQGLTNREIAKVLRTATGTVNTHLHHIIRKLGVSNRTQAAARAIRNGLAKE